MRTRRTLAHSVLMLLALALVSAPGCAKKAPPPPSPISQRQPPPAAPDTTHPEVQPPSPVETAFVPGDIHFDYDKSNIRDDARPALTALGKHLLDHPEVKVRIEGNCDERGTTDYNLALGERRAKAAQDWLIAYGVGAGRVSTISYGKERPLDPGHDESAWAKNRRDHFVLN
jgi:peptidoglycan-associated lipoprotein